MWLFVEDSMRNTGKKQVTNFHLNDSTVWHRRKFEIHSMEMFGIQFIIRPLRGVWNCVEAGS